MFSEIIENINERKWIFDEKIPLVYGLLMKLMKVQQ